MVWYGMVWYGMVWYGMVWYGIVLYCITLMDQYCKQGFPYWKGLLKFFNYGINNKKQHSPQTELIL